MREARLLVDRKALYEWSESMHGRRLRIVDAFARRPPLFIFGGDVGTGKSALAETFADAVARECDIDVTLYALALNARGGGAVGEMTRLISAAFGEVRSRAKKGADGRHASVLLIDEADALAQSREFAQMHHEDRAGVNALIRGIDEITAEELKVIVVMCTNRLDSLDPAVRRRAARTFVFSRPNTEQRAALLRNYLADADFPDEAIERIAALTGPRGAREYGCTYADLMHRYLPDVVMDAFPELKLRADRAEEIATSFEPSPPFNGSSEE